MPEKAYYAFFLGFLPDAKDESPSSYAIKLAVFGELSDDSKTVTTIRKIIDANTFDLFDVDFGDTIVFKLEGKLERGSIVKIQDFPRELEYMQRHVSRNKQHIVYCLKKVCVVASELIVADQYEHEIFGTMLDPQQLVVPGIFEVFVFTVKIHPTKPEFLLIVENATPSSEMVEPQNDTLRELSRFERLPEILRIEEAHNKNSEQVTWNAIGHLQLISFDDTDPFCGLRPVLKLLDMSHEKLFSSQDGSAISLVKQVIKDGNEEEWEDVEIVDGGPQGTFFTADEVDNEARCIVKLSKTWRNKVDDYFEVGDIVRVIAESAKNSADYYESGNHVRNLLFQQTIQKPASATEHLMFLGDLLEHKLQNKKDIAEMKDEKVYQCNLNEMQWKAVMMGTNEKRKLVFIQGPPGTGKTTTLGNIIWKLVQDKKQVIVLTPTHESLRNIKRLVAHLSKKRSATGKFNKNSLLDYKLYSKLLQAGEKVEEVAEELRKMRAEVKNGTMKRAEFEQLSIQKSTALTVERTDQIMKNVSVVFSTIQASFATTMISHPDFNPSVCILDEAAQVTEAMTWPAIDTMDRVIMAGDPQQLPALVLSKAARDFKLENSVMYRLMPNKERISWVTLEEQYRMHQEIAEWSNQMFYDRALKHATNPQRTLRKLFCVFKNFEMMFDPLVFIDTSIETASTKREDTYEHIKCGISDQTRAQGAFTYANRAEVEIVVAHYSRLLEVGVKPESVAVITPYRGQLEDVMTALTAWRQKILTDDENADENEKRKKRNLRPILENFDAFRVGTVDRYQGQEFDVVIFSLVRSNPKLTLGFVQDTRRLNVALTRAKLQFVLIGNGFMMMKSNEEKIRQLFILFCKEKKRFPACYAFGRKEQFDATECKDNFGRNFESFRDFTEDNDMRKWIDNYCAVQKEPEFQLKRATAKAVKKKREEAEKAKGKWEPTKK
ncbi:unnamed protein product [Caenorhabditis sp. 36 PRJEB53466]|nr:unnamed protein product [Caenorhabditis sp. 36 PRJEB53466]